MGFSFKLFSKKKSKSDLELIKFFVQKFGYRPINLGLFVQAVTHRSLTNLNDDNSNERLEYLGDAVLDLIVAEYLYTKFPNEDEGYLTKVKSKVVSRKTLSEIGEALELRLILRYNKGRTINLQSLEGNAFEAIIGAIYLDSNFQKTKAVVINRVFRTSIDLNKILEEEIDFKSRLFIWSQKKHLSLEFEILNESNKNGTWFYEVIVVINGVKYGKGNGTSKKVAEQHASQETLGLMGEI